VLPRDVGVVHYEAEMVVVIGKTARNVPREDALDYVFGVTCGNDVSAREWQKGDVQWWRAKGSDTFGPCGPAIVCGLDYDNLMMELRLNGEVRQKESTKQLIHDVAGTLSFISRYVTLHPGDLIFTGTPGQTDEIKAGDVVEVEIEGVGVLRNKVVREE
jgi:2-keto-4-pentenoate hydratase/2-oxohepta-3-ene-1,7-dioic acid hydratase in catechol pathway